MSIGAHVESTDPIAEAAARGADLAQIFLSDPQGWKVPQSRPDVDRLRSATIDFVVHAPYVLNVATLNNRIRIPSRKLLTAHAKVAAEIGALGLVVHGGHVSKDDDPEAGFSNWRKLFERAADDGGFPLPILIENTAGGDNAMARHLDRFARLWDAVGEFGPGVCLDTCHAHAAGIELADVVEKVRGITGRIDVVHANDSKDEFGSARDRHENIGDGQIGLDAIAAVIAAAEAPVVLETHGTAERQAADIAELRKAVDAIG
ncbi:MAG TPA: deoxyribonuclease IV [Mycobacteriales bacterium]|nr:deoxyribonuclease IV [Mycobacteriales bacterium]